MNWTQFQKNAGMRVRIEPSACWLGESGHVLPESNEEWLIETISADAINLRNVTTGHVVELGKDHVYDYRSDPTRTTAVTKYGYLVLKMQVFVQGYETRLRPNARPGERVTPSDLPHHQLQWTEFLKVDARAGFPMNAKRVSIQYRLWSDVPAVPLLLRVASNPEGTLRKELSGPSGVIELTIIEPQTFYVSFSHPLVKYELLPIGYTI